jgi:hypothetical protein
MTEKQVVQEGIQPCHPERRAVILSAAKDLATEPGPEKRTVDWQSCHPERRPVILSAGLSS